MLAAFAVASFFFPVSVVSELVIAIAKSVIAVSVVAVSVVAVFLVALFLVFLVVVAAEV